MDIGNEAMFYMTDKKIKAHAQVNTKPIRKLLIIEDQPDIRNLIKMAFGFDQYQVHEASDAQVGLKMVHAIQPDLVLLDILMPTRLEVNCPDILDGLDLCRSLKNDPEYANIPIILLTAKGQVVDKNKGLAVGADDYIVKPFSIIHLIEVVQHHLNKGL